MSRVPWTWAVVAWWPPLWLALGAWLGAVTGWWAVPWFLILPPLLVRSLAPWAPAGRHAVGSWPAWCWWCQYQVQLPFNRLPWCEELLRLLPGASSLWLALWGGRLSPLAHWGPGARATDRQWVRVQAGAVLGAGALLGTHAVLHADEGWVVLVGPVTIEAGAVVGARCVLGPGSSVAAGTMLPATRPLPPGQRWNGRGRERDHG